MMTTMYDPFLLPRAHLLFQPFSSSSACAPDLALRRRRRERAASSAFRDVTGALINAVVSVDDDHAALYSDDQDGRRIFPTRSHHDPKPSRCEGGDRKPERKESSGDAALEHTTTSMIAYSSGPVRRTVRRYKDNTGRERFSEERWLGRNRHKVKWDNKDVDEDGVVRKHVETNFANDGDGDGDGDKYTLEKFEEEWKGLHLGRTGKRARIEGTAKAHDTSAETKGGDTSGVPKTLPTGDKAADSVDLPENNMDTSHTANHGANNDTEETRPTSPTDDSEAVAAAENSHANVQAEVVEQLEKEVEALKEKIAQLRGGTLAPKRSHIENSKDNAATQTMP